MRMQLRAIKDETGEEYYLLGMFKPMTWLKLDTRPMQIVQLIEWTENRAIVRKFNEAEPSRVSPTVECYPATEDDLSRAEMIDEWARSNAREIDAKLNPKKVILSDQPVSTSVGGGMFSHKADCPVCGKSVWVTTANKFLPHGPTTARCAQSGKETL